MAGCARPSGPRGAERRAGGRGVGLARHRHHAQYRQGLADLVDGEPDPGAHGGPFIRANAWAALNASRHAGSPNVLYVDGHVAADATRALTAGDLGACSYGSWAGSKLTSWPDRDPTFGSLNHIAPICEFYK